MKAFVLKTFRVTGTLLLATAVSGQDFVIEPIRFTNLPGTSTDGNFAVSGAFTPADGGLMSGGGFAIAGGFRSVVPAPPALPAELIVNGSFENTAGTFVADRNQVMSLLPGSTVIPGWTTTDAELAWLTNGAVGLVSPAGGFFLDLSGYHDGPPYGGLTQTITTVPGQSYRLSLSLGTYQFRVRFQGPVSVSVTAGAARRSLAFTPAPFGTVGNDWGTITWEFIAEATTTAVTITGETAFGGAYVGLDNVSVTGAPAPEESEVTVVSSAMGELRLSFPTKAGRSYVIESRSDLAAGEWVAVPDSTKVGTGAALEVSLPLPAAQPQQFYRIRQLP